MQLPVQIITTAKGVMVRPRAVSLDELAEKVGEWKDARDRAGMLWENRPPGSGPDLSPEENAVQSAADDVLELLEIHLTSNDARDVSDLLFTASCATFKTEETPA